MKDFISRKQTTLLPVAAVPLVGAISLAFASPHEREAGTDASRLPSKGGGVEETEIHTVQSKKSGPTMDGAFPSLPGTAWKIESAGSIGVATFLFCKSGRWEVVPGQVGHIGAMGKSYKVSGKTLTTTNADDKKVEKFEMSWKDSVLELNDGKTVQRLHYNGETKC